MGWGDEIMAAGRAREARATDPRPVLITHRRGKPRWHEAWRCNPNIVHPHDALTTPHQVLADGPGCRPYVDTTDKRRWRFIPGEQTRGDLFLSERERWGADFKIPYAVVAPMVKEPGGNKDWGLDRFALVVRLTRHIPWVELAPKGRHAIAGAFPIATETFRDAAGVLSGASLLLAPEGGMHHAAAALRVPAVVIFGGFIHPSVTGYPDQVSLVDGGPETPCGNRARCRHCQRALAAIDPGVVAEHVQRVWTEGRADASWAPAA